MKKIPTLFKREFENHKVVGVTDEITPGCEDAFYHGVATVKFDGSCCAIIDGKFYKRYDAKKGKKAPEGAIPCCDPDPVTGHHPHWVEINKDDPADKWFIAALENTASDIVDGDGTYEAIGKHFNGNPYGLLGDGLIKHGLSKFDFCPRTFEGVKGILTHNEIEGLVFWLNNEPVCKIKRSDFGLPWPVTKE